MRKWQKIGIGVGGAAVLGAIVLISINQATKDVVTVQTAKVARQDLVSQVTASGEIKPTTYTNIYAEGFGKITAILVKEGDQVKKRDRLLLQESIQQSADVQAQTAALTSSEAGILSSEANYKAAQAELQQRRAEAERTKLDWERSQGLYKDGLIPKSEYDTRRAAYDSAAAAAAASEARVTQLRAEMERARSQRAQSQAVLARTRDTLRKTTYTSPINGIISYLPVRVGENVVPGIQNATGSFLMTISDMSVVTAEVKVDETDIITVKNGQDADVTIDAVPGKVFKGKVTEIGSQAVLRSSGLATTQTSASSQEAKDFKVVVTLAAPLANLRPGLSATAKVWTAERKNVLSVPIQALAVRTRKDLEEAAKQTKGKSDKDVTLAAPPPAPGGTDSKKDEIQGVFVVRGKKAFFTLVETGISGVTDIEVTAGLKPGDEIVTGSYKALRTLKPEASVKVDNSAPKKQQEQ